MALDWKLSGAVQSKTNLDFVEWLIGRWRTFFLILRNSSWVGNVIQSFLVGRPFLILHISHWVGTAIPDDVNQQGE